jgi:tetratricopeptide (TPR) repeat protein
VTPASTPRPPRGTRPRWPSALLLTLLLAAAGYWPVTQLVALAHFHAARAADESRDFPRATAELAHCLRAWPDDPEVRLLAARVGWRSLLARPFAADWDRPLRAHLSVAERAPAFLDAVAVETAVLDLLTNATRGRPHRLTARAADDHPDAVPVLEALTRAHLDSHQLPQAFEYAETLLRRAPGHALAHFWRGLTLELMGRWRGEATDSYRAAADLDPDNFDFRLRLAGYLALRKENLGEARERLQHLHAEQPDNPDVLHPLAAVLIDLGENAAARPLVERLAALRPADGDPLAMLGRLDLAADRPAAAEPHLRAAVARSPGSYDANYHLALCLRALDKPDEANAALGRAERLKADRDEITRLYRRVQEKGAEPRVRYELGVRHLRVGDTQVGLTWLTSALDIDPEFEPARHALAEQRAIRSR